MSRSLPLGDRPSLEYPGYCTDTRYQPFALHSYTAAGYGARTDTILAWIGGESQITRRQRS